MRFVFAILISVVGLSAAPSEACSRLAQITIRGFDALPADGSRVPRSTSLWVRSELTDGATLTDLSALRLVDERGKLISLSTSQVRVSGERSSSLFVFKPLSLLEANTAYRLELGTKVLTNFSTSDEVDSVPPATPKARLAEVNGGVAVTATGCGAPSTVTVELETPGDVNFLVPESVSGSAMPGSALAVANGSDLRANSVPEGPLTLRVVAFDLSGNMAVSPERLSATVPLEANSLGCSVGLGAPLSLLALLVLRRRR